MTLLQEFEQATHDAELARLRRVLAVRAMVIEGASQREIAERLGVTQPAISYLVSLERTNAVRPSVLVMAGASVLRAVAEGRGFADLAVFGSAARGDDTVDSDVDLLVQPPLDADMLDMIRLEEALTAVLGRKVDLVSYRGLDPRLDADILCDRVVL